MKGLIHIYCGDGKGKTSAAVGLALRCAGGGGKVLFVRFLKDNKSGEVKALEKTDGIEVMGGYEKMKFSFDMSAEEKKAASLFFEKLLEDAAEKIKTSKYDLAVFDELVTAAQLGFVDKNNILDMTDKRGETETVLTGRDPDACLLDIADYVSEIKKIKHPFDRGIKARKYIEF